MISASEAISIMIRTILRRWCDHHMVDVSHKFGFDGDTLLFIYGFLCQLTIVHWGMENLDGLSQLISVSWCFFSIFVPSSFFCLCFLKTRHENGVFKVDLSSNKISKALVLFRTCSLLGNGCEMNLLVRWMIWVEFRNWSGSCWRCLGSVTSDKNE